MKKDFYITVGHFDECFGSTCFRVGQKLTLRKDHDDPYDDEAIAVFNENGSRCGYVSNSVSTVARGTYSAGRVYDEFEEEAECIVRFITEDILIGEVELQSRKERN